MSDDKQPAAEDGAKSSSEASAAQTDPVAELEAPPPPDEEAAEAAAQIESLQDQVLRAQAEMENVRRRAARDVENAHKYALEKFAGELLPVLDSLEKAIEAADDAEAGAALTEGIRLSLKLFLTTLEKVGISQLDPLGEPFDPQLHEAMAMVPNPDAEPNSVMEVMQKGYVLNGRLLRAAKVVVVSAPAEA